MTELIQYARRFIGVKYYWGGDTPMQGFDCSGLVQEILSFAGIDPAGDQTAQELYEHFVKNRSDLPPGRGSLVFYGENLSKITHVGFMSTPFTVLEAAGGNSEMKGPGAFDAAVSGKAFVKERPLSRRKDVVAIITPIYPKWLLEN